MSAFRRAFTFVEIAVVIIIIGILVAMVVPQFGNVSDDARTAATQGTLASVRASIAAFRTARLLAGGDPFPTHAELTTLGTVTEQAIPPNPFTGVSGVQLVSPGDATARAVSHADQYGWNYYVDNQATPPVVIIYANCENNTTALDGNGAARKASDL